MQLRSYIALLAAPALAVSSAAQTFAPLHGGHFPGAGTVRPPEIDDLLLGDIDGDGAPDLVLLGDYALRVLRNDGAGGFVLLQDLDSFRSYRRGALADTDGDGDLDLLAGVGSHRPSRTQRGNLFQYENRGGTFVDVTAQRMPAWSALNGEIAVFDHDGDGDLDLASSPLWQSGLLLYDNDGRGNFTPSSATRLPAGFSPSPAVVLVPLDLDGDRDLDLVGSTDPLGFTPIPVYALRNDGTGRFTDVTSSLPSPAERILAVLDIDRDGDLDLVRSARIDLNGGSGTFTARSLGQTFVEQDAVRAADFDGDGREDLVRVRFGYVESLPSIYLARTDGTFEHRPEWIPSELRTAYAVTSLTSTWVGGAALAVADFDRNGRPDVVHGGWKGHSQGGSWTIGLPPKVLINEHGARFREGAARPLAMIENEVFGIEAGDLDGDGDLDLIFGETQDRVHRNRGDGTFEIGPALPGSGQFQSGVLADLDEDGDLDFVRTSSEMGMPRAGVLALALQQGGAWVAAPLPVTPHYVHAIAAGDIDADGDLDLILGCFQGPGSGAPARCFRNDGTGGFTDATAGRLPTAAFATEMAVLRDFDGDLDLDLIEHELRYAGGRLRFSLNDGSGVFTDATSARLPAVTGDSLAVVDWEGDGDSDLVLSGTTLRNDGTGRFAAQPNTIPRFEHLVDLDGSGTWTNVLGDRDLVQIGSRYIYWGGGSMHTTLPADVDLDGDLDVIGAANLGFQSYDFSLIPDILFNLRTQLQARRLLRIGQPWVLALQSTSIGSFAVLLVSSHELAPRLALPPFGWLGVDPTRAFVLSPTPVGLAPAAQEIALPVPLDVALLNEEIFAQALIVPPSGLAHARFTGVARDRMTW